MRVPRSQLKVFSPLDAFPEAERERWTAYVRAAGGLTRRQHADAEAAAATRLLIGLTPLSPDAALVRRHGRRVMVCPLDLDLRAARALTAFRQTVPDALVDTFVPSRTLRGALETLASTNRAPHVLDEPWSVPLHWFVAFDPAERRVRDHPEGHGVRVLYVTRCDQALERLERAAEVVEGTIEDGEDILDSLESLTSWLEAFDPSSLLELDYGSVAGLFAAAQLREDTTCEDLWDAVEALEQGDLMTAAAGYGIVRARWSAQWAMQRTN